MEQVVWMPPSTPNPTSHGVPSLQQLHAGLQKGSQSLFTRGQTQKGRQGPECRSELISSHRPCSSGSINHLTFLPLLLSHLENGNPSSLAWLTRPSNRSVRGGQRCERLFAQSEAGLRDGGNPFPSRRWIGRPGTGGTCTASPPPPNPGAAETGPA